MPTNKPTHSYSCHGPFAYGTGQALHGQGVCLHGWNTPHTLSDEMAQHTDHLTNCGLLPDRQRIEKLEE